MSMHVLHVGLLSNCRHFRSQECQALRHTSAVWQHRKMSNVDPACVGKQLLNEPIKRVNNVTKLLKLVSVNGAETACRVAAHYLKLFFLGAYERGDIPNTSAQSAAAKPDKAQVKLASWLQDRFNSFIVELHLLLQSRQSTEVQIFALNILLEIVRGQQTGIFSQALYASTASILLGSSTVSDDTIEAFKSKYLGFADVRFYTLRAIQSISQDGPARDAVEAADALRQEQLGQRLFTVLSDVAPTLQEAAEDSAAVPSWCGATEAGVVGVAADRAEGSQRRKKRKREQEQVAAPTALLGGVQWANPSAYKRAFSDAWLGLLRLPLPPQLLKQVLVQLHTSVMPALPNPLLLADFLTSCLDQGGMLGILALNGIFTLVTRHGLEYPAFYARLYALLQAPVFRAKYRARFLQLADIFLSSGMVPAYTAAAFIKKFARLALTAPPAGAIIAIAFVHNLLRRHPSCSVLVHRPATQRPSTVESAVTAKNDQQPQTNGVIVGNSASQSGHPVEKSLNVGQTGSQPSLPFAGTASSTSHAQQNGVPSYALPSSSDSDAGDGDVINDMKPAAAAVAATNAKPAVDSSHTENGHSASVQSHTGADVFDEAELDPAKSRAIESSLWEIESLRQHYYHTVATYVSILDRDLGDRKKTAEVDMTALLKSSYSSLMALETEKRLKSVPIAFYPTPPQQLFSTTGNAEFPGWVC